MAQPTVPKTQYQLTDNLKNAVRSVLSAGQNYVNGGAIRINRSDTEAEVPRIDVNVNQVSRASLQMAAYSFVVVSGAGTSAANGTYLQTGEYGGKAQYHKNGEGNSYAIQWGSTQWELVVSGNVLYSLIAPTPSGTWTTNGGSAPAPTSLYYANYFYNHFAADLSITVVSDRYNGGATHHEDIVQSVRYLMAREAQSFVSPVVTWYEVLDIEEEGETHEVEPDTREDHSVINYRIQLGILPASYRVPSSGHSA